MTRESGGRHPSHPGKPPLPTIRAVVRIAPVRSTTARGRASVAGALDPALRSAPPYVPPPPRARGRAHAQSPAHVDPAADPGAAAAEAGGDPDSDPAEIGTDPDPSAPAPASKHDVRSMPERLRNRGRRAILPVVAALLAAFVAGTGYLMIQEPPATDDVGRWTGTPPSAVPSDAAPYAVPVDGTTPDPFATGGPAATGMPTRLRVAAIGVDTALETLRTEPGGELAAPENFARAGWYADGTLPGDTGPAVIAGHVDSRRGPAVFYRLRELERGDRIEVVRGGRTLSFTVTSTAWYPKDAFPTEEVYGPTPDRQLRLITCGGVFDHSLRSYKDNLVVYAVAG